jgi:hypothetical protein
MTGSAFHVDRYPAWVTLCPARDRPKREAPLDAAPSCPSTNHWPPGPYGIVSRVFRPKDDPEEPNDTSWNAPYARWLLYLVSPIFLVYSNVYFIFRINKIYITINNNMYSFGNQPSQINPFRSSGTLSFAVPMGQRVHNDIRATHEEHMAKRSGFGMYSDPETRALNAGYGRSRFGYGMHEEPRILQYGARNLDSDDDSGYDTDDATVSMQFGKKSAATKKNHANASKAMKMAHSKGISLKAAWAIVKKGDKKKKTTKRK